jgi:hypothetical protein
VQPQGAIDYEIFCFPTAPKFRRGREEFRRGREEFRRGREE